METIKSVGKINYISNIADGVGARIANDFLTKMVKHFAIRSKNYIKSVNEAPFIYRERQIHSILAPAISDLTPVSLMEYPVDRQWSKLKDKKWGDSTGWVDYWCRYRNVDFFVELKHGYNSFLTSNIRSSLQESWKYMNEEQLGIINKDAKWLSQYSKGVVKIGLHIITTYEKSKTLKSIENIDKHIDIQHIYFENLKPKPNWSAIWLLNANLAN